MYKLGKVRVDKSYSCLLLQAKNVNCLSMIMNSRDDGFGRVAGHDWQTTMVTANLIVAQNWSRLQYLIGGRVVGLETDTTGSWSNGWSASTITIAFVEAVARKADS